MRPLPVIELSPVRATQARLAPWVHAARVIVAVLLLVGLHRWAKSHAVATGQSAPSIVELAIIEPLLPAAASLQPLQDDPSQIRVLGAAGEKLGRVAQTLPHAERIVGYAGPSNVLIVMDEQGRVTATHLLRCPDTVEHLRKVQSSRAFWNQFIGWQWGQTATVRVDGVSGATLTSLAIAEAVAWRMATAAGMSSAGPPPIRASLRFAGELDIQQLRKWFSGAARVQSESVFEATILDAAGDSLGSVIRTGPLADAVIGYQGPSEVIFRMDDDDATEQTSVVADLMLGESFDNQPYINYVKQEASFWRKFKGRTLESLATLDLDEEQIDGVSGATMTSIAVAETIRDASAALLEHREQTAQVENELAQGAVGAGARVLRWNWSPTELATAGLALVALLWSRSRLRGMRLPRLIWQASCVVLLGLVSGNLLSVALLGGWTRGGIAWRLAPGLTVLVIVALVGTAISKGNVYCDHLCPHGILQQWIRPRRSRQVWSWLQRALWLSAFAVIGITLLGVLIPLTANLAWLEPFDAYVVRVGVSFSLVVWALSLVLARLKPMAYCRLACPTGKLLDYARRDAASHRIGAGDLIVLMAAVALWVL